MVVLSFEVPAIVFLICLMFCVRRCSVRMLATEESTRDLDIRPSNNGWPFVLHSIMLCCELLSCRRTRCVKTVRSSCDNGRVGDACNEEDRRV